MPHGRDDLAFARDTHVVDGLGDLAKEAHGRSADAGQGAQGLLGVAGAAPTGEAFDVEGRFLLECRPRASTLARRQAIAMPLRCSKRGDSQVTQGMCFCTSGAIA